MNMKTEIYKLPYGCFLADIEPFNLWGLPTDSFVHKVIPGCGATTLELMFARNSIIVEPNLPVIIGKCASMNVNEKGRRLRKNKLIMGVHEGVTIEDIKRYIKECKGYKKILTTPEGFSKVMAAIGKTAYQDYFLLFDECEKAIQDIDFRTAVINPIDEFFRFEQKAFVSATPIIPSDERFKDFKIVKIIPDYEFKEDITVSSSNNVVFNLKKIIDSYNWNESGFDRKFFVFLKSTKRIKNIIKGFKIDNQSAVYCSEDSKKELTNINGLTNVYDKVGNTFQLFNFLTSRFFSAVDIDYKMYKCNPIIIMISDVVAVEHTVIDPHTEAIQIAGRFRKPIKKNGEPEILVEKGIYHISNYSTKLTSFSVTEIHAILKDKRNMHEFITKFKPKSDIEYFQKFIEEILKMNGFNCFLRDGELSSFMVDNFIYKERVKSYYNSKRNLIEEYRKSDHFIVDKSSKAKFYSISDEELTNISDTTSTLSLNDKISSLIRESMAEVGDNEVNFELTFLNMSYPEQFSVISSYGWESAKHLDYNINRIQAELEKRKKFEGLLPLIKYLHKKVDKGVFYADFELTDIIQNGIEQFNLNHLKAKPELLRNAVKLSDRKTRIIEGKKVNGYIIEDYLQDF